MNFESLINFEAPGGRCDVTPVFADPAAFADLVARTEAALEGHGVDLVAGIDALGFILGAALAQKMGLGFLPIRKAGKLPVSSDREDFTDYSGQAKSLELAHGVVPTYARIVVVDDWVETGAQARAAIALLERQGGQVVAVAAMKMDKPGKELGLGDRYCVGLL
ncbi:MAG TPA: phosphoribosyltransferase family protein [bacterium]|nr:phosphoribosyltransferase family protein [bacterium]